MVANRIESTKPGPESAADKNAVAAPAAAAGGGIKAWLPLIANLVLMPVLAYGTIHFLVLPKLQGGHAASAAAANPGEGTHEGGAGGSSADDKSNKVVVPLSGKVLVNVAGTMGTRYLVACITLVSHNPELKSLMDKNDAELHDAASSTLQAKTISDLEKPGSRNLIRSELMAVFNNILGSGTVTEIYLPEFAIQ